MAESIELFKVKLANEYAHKYKAMYRVKYMSKASELEKQLKDCEEQNRKLRFELSKLKDECVELNGKLDRYEELANYLNKSASIPKERYEKILEAIMQFFTSVND